MNGFPILLVDDGLSFELTYPEGAVLEPLHRAAHFLLALPTTTKAARRILCLDSLLLVWPCAVGPSVTTTSTDFSFQNLVFF
jgi:hypothetical protein